jgi:hypothetical protein
MAAKDPVCGMMAEEAKAAGSAEHGGVAVGSRPFMRLIQVKAPAGAPAMLLA